MAAQQCLAPIQAGKFRPVGFGRKYGGRRLNFFHAEAQESVGKLKKRFSQRTQRRKERGENEE
jgi:hypothetical protein